MASACFVLFLLLYLSIPLSISQANTTARIQVSAFERTLD